MLKDLIYIADITLIILFAFTAAYMLLFAISGKVKLKTEIPQTSIKRKYAILIPAYREDEIIEDIIDQALQQHYPSDLYDIILIADGFKKETLTKLKNNSIILFNVNFTNSTKTKAIQYALNNLENKYDIGLILDADNVMEENYLQKLNSYFSKGCQVVQTHRIAKNSDTSYSILDGVSEEINNTIFRRGHRALGLSSALIGSGMAFEFNLLKELLVEAKAINGFDKELEFNLLKKSIETEYAEDVFIYDEKVQKAQAFADQRKRWIVAQIEHFAKNLVPGIIAFIKYGNIDYLNKVIQMALPPRSLLVGFVPLSAIIHLLLFYFSNKTLLLILAFVWSFLFTITGISFLIAMPQKYYSKETFFAISRIPKAIGHLSHKLLFINSIRKHFSHTKHTIKKTNSKQNEIIDDISTQLLRN